MPAPIAELIPLTVLAASVVGSGHCVAMCGGIVASSVGGQARPMMGYHLGRLLGYLALGALAGMAGQAVFGSPLIAGASWVSAVLMAGIFVHLGVRVWRGGAPHLFALPAPVSRLLYRHARGRPWTLGLFTALLPCGWLHGFVLAAVATRSAFGGALLLLLFWAGTLPALVSVSLITRRAVPALSPRRMPRLSGALLISAGLLSLALRISMASGLRLPARHNIPAGAHATPAGSAMEGCPFH